MAAEVAAEFETCEVREVFLSMFSPLSPPAKGAPSPIPFDEVIEVARAGFDIVDLLEG